MTVPIVTVDDNGGDSDGQGGSIIGGSNGHRISSNGRNPQCEGYAIRVTRKTLVVVDGNGGNQRQWR